MTNEKILMTITGHKKLKEELENLIKFERPTIKKSIQEARELGDLKENSEYHSAKEKQSLVEGKINELQYKLNNAKIIDSSKLNGPIVRFGATVTLTELDSSNTEHTSVTYRIVGEDEANSKSHFISYKGPLGQAIIGKEEGDIVTVKAPKGPKEYEIEKIEYK